jgi:hypothetical protein
MGKDIFGYEATHGGSFKKTSKGGFAFTGAGAIALVQNWSVQYQHTVNPLYEVGSDKVYWTGSHAAGTLSITRIVSRSAKDIVSLLGQLCDPKAPRIVAAEDCEGGTVSLQLNGCIVQSVSWSGNSQNAYVEEQVQAQFVGLEYDVTSRV